MVDDDLTLSEFRKRIESERRASQRSEGGEFGHLGDQVYLDFAANGVYMAGLISEFQAKLTGSALFSNPHSHSQSGAYTGLFVELTRQKILRMLGASKNEYDVVFVANATHGLKVLAETFQFGGGFFAYLNDNHTSVVGMRESVWQARPATPVFCLFEKDESDESGGIRYTAKQLKSPSETGGQEKQTGAQPRRNLVVYPAQSNFNGRKYPLGLVDEIQSGRLAALVEPAGQLGSSEADEWFVCLDTASYFATSALDLAATKPDFLVLSFYKLFGFPTGVGALLVRKTEKTRASLKKSYFGGGTVAVALVDENKFYFRGDRAEGVARSSRASLEVHEHFEDGTVPYLDIIGVSLAIDKLEAITFKQGMRLIERYLETLADFCLARMSELRHGNGQRVVEIYRKKGRDGHLRHGPIIAFNLKTSLGRYVGYNLVEKLAQANKIHLRTGCFCNIGACQMFLTHLRDNRVLEDNYLLSGHRCGDHIDLIDGLPTGAVRVSFGYCTTFADLEAFVSFLEANFVEKETLALESSTSTSRPAPRKEQQYFKITHLYIYPIKSCGPMEIIESWPIKQVAVGEPVRRVNSGFKFDREWIILDSNHIQFTQKRLPLLSQILPFIDLDRGEMVLEFAPTGETFALELEALEKGAEELETVILYGNNLSGIDEGPRVGEWLAEMFGLSEPCFLVRIVSDVAGSNQRSSFANKADFLLINQKSVERVRCSRLEEIGLELDRQQLARVDEYFYQQFRANIVVETADDSDGFDEETWSGFEVLNSSGLEFQVVENCARCQMINIDQEIRREKRDGARTEPTERVDLGRLSAGLLKKIYEIKQNTKFGIYLSASSARDESQASAKAGPDRLSVGQIGLAKSASTHQGNA